MQLSENALGSTPAPPTPNIPNNSALKLGMVIHT